jgi:hypothetical protein
MQVSMDGFYTLNGWLSPPSACLLADLQWRELSSRTQRLLLFNLEHRISAYATIVLPSGHNREQEGGFFYGTEEMK